MSDTGAQGQPGPTGTPGNGQIEDPELSARLAARTAQAALNTAQNLSTAQRLSRRAKHETLKIPFEDDLGTFEIEIRIPTSAELDELMKLQKKVGEAGKSLSPEGPAEVDRISEELYKKMEDLCTDPSLTAEFFKSGDFLGSDFGQIIKEIFIEEERRISNISSFRKKPNGPGTVRII